jgi:hypothetical protein
VRISRGLIQGDVGRIQVFSEKDGKRTLNADIYYKAGQVHVINHDEGWNLVTKGREAYEWEAGKKEGQITKLNDKDLIDYLLYLTDPSCIMNCIYHDAVFEPGKFVPPKEVERGTIERRFKEPVEAFRAVFVVEIRQGLRGDRGPTPVRTHTVCAVPGRAVPGWRQKVEDRRLRWSPRRPRIRRWWARRHADSTGP